MRDAPARNHLLFFINIKPGGFMDSESLPTGIEMPSAGQSSRTNAFTVANNFAYFAGHAAATIQLQESSQCLKYVQYRRRHSGDRFAHRHRHKAVHQ
jgi:hypothetical protein